MYVTNTTDDFGNVTLTSCTGNENFIDLTKPLLLLAIPCGLSFFCSMSLITYAIIKPLYNKKNGEVSLPNSSNSFY